MVANRLSQIKPRNKLLLVGLTILLIVVALLLTFLPSAHQASKSINIFQFANPKIEFGVTQALPETLALNPAKVALGHKLFHDARLSGDNTVSCANCHSLATGGVDNRIRSIGIKGGIGSVNSPTIFNTAFNFVQFWDGRATSLEDQVDGPINHPKEMGSNWKQVISKLQQDKNYVSEFKNLYTDGISVVNIKDAIATFDRSLVTPNARFDKFLRGDMNAINTQEKNGYALFQSYGCASCHQGMNLGGNMFEKMGLMGDYFADRGNITEADKGRYNLNHHPDSMHEFRVPSLRNVALTAPYFHDGNAKTLEEAISIMAKYQLGRPMPQTDVDAIAAFLRTLTGEYQGKPL